MNLDRIHFKVQGDNLLILTQVSELKKLNLVVKFDKSLYSVQTINTGSNVNALNLKNIEQFKGLKPFVVLDNNQIFDLYDSFGVYDKKDITDFKINVGDLVNYNSRNFIVLGIVVNTYAQWNLPTPLLFNPSAMANDVKSLYGSRLTEQQIIEKINDNFQKGKYDSDIIIPLVDMAKPKDIIKVVKQNISDSETLEIFSKIEKLKKANFEIKKDVFINTIADLKAKEIISLKEQSESLYDSFNLFAKSLNDIINKKIEAIPRPKTRKPRAKKVVEKAEPVIEKQLLRNLENTKFWFGDDKALGQKVLDRAVELGRDRIDLNDSSNALYFSAGRTFHSSSNRAFFDNEPEREIFYEDLFGVQKPESTSVEPEPVSDELPDFIEGISKIKLQDLPEPIKNLALLEMYKHKIEATKEQIQSSLKKSNLLSFILWEITSQGREFWAELSDGNLTEFKKQYGKNGEKATELLIEFLKDKKETPKEEKPETQEVLGVAVKLYLPKGGYVEIQTNNLYELHDICRYILNRRGRKEMKLNFIAFTEKSPYLTKITIDSLFEQDDLIRELKKNFDTFVEPRLDWTDFSDRIADIDRIEQNQKTIDDALDEKPVEAEKPKPVKVEKPKVEKPKAEKPKVEKPKIVKEKKSKTDELSFLDELDNIL